MDIFVGHNTDKDGLENIPTDPDMLLKSPKKRIRKRYPVIPKNCPMCSKEVKYLNDHIKMSTRRNLQKILFAMIVEKCLVNERS